MSSSGKRQATPKSKPRRAGKAPVRLLLTVGAGLGVGVALTLGYLHFHGPHRPAHREIAVPPQPPVPPTPRVAAKPARPAADSAPDKPRFDFYTMLPKLKVFVPEAGRDAPDAARNRAAGIDGRGTYVLQVGSFRHLDDADRVKAKLALLGVEADIYTVRVNDQTWHRLRVGPYSDVKKLRDITARLRDHHVDYMVLKIKG